MTQREYEGSTGRAPEDIQREIEHTRAVMKQDVREIGEKFTPDQIKENAKGILSDAKQEGATMIRETKDAAVGSLTSARDRAVDAVSETAHGLSDRARHAGEMAGDYARRAGGYAQRAGTATTDFVTTNAIPLSLIGLGVGWLALSMRRAQQPNYAAGGYVEGEDYLGWDEDYYSADDEYASPRQNQASGLASRTRSRVEGLTDSARQRASGLAEGARERASGLAESARGIAATARERAANIAERASHGVDTARTRVANTASQLGHQASELSHEARERLQRAQLRTRDFADENPLAVGAIAIAAGVGVGLLLPATQPENRLMGRTRDRIVGDARELITEARDATGRVAQKARETAQEVRGSISSSDRVAH